jgi:very-short-patch-repair endonuclease
LPTRKESDKLKNELVRKYGYTLIRIKDTEAKNIDILLKIKKLYENQIKGN